MREKDRKAIQLGIMECSSAASALELIFAKPPQLSILGKLHPRPPEEGKTLYLGFFSPGNVLGAFSGGEKDVTRENITYRAPQELPKNLIRSVDRVLLAVGRDQFPQLLSWGEWISSHLRPEREVWVIQENSPHLTNDQKQP